MLSGSFGVLSLCLRHRSIVLHFQAFTAASCHTSSSRDSNSSKKELLMAEEAAKRAEAYQQLENLDFKSAAKILFTTPPKRKKFGQVPLLWFDCYRGIKWLMFWHTWRDSVFECRLDFHLVQLFFTCLPSLGISSSYIKFYAWNWA